MCALFLLLQCLLSCSLCVGLQNSDPLSQQSYVSFVASHRGASHLHLLDWQESENIGGAPRAVRKVSYFPPPVASFWGVRLAWAPTQHCHRVQLALCTIVASFPLQTGTMSRVCGDTRDVYCGTSWGCCSIRARTVRIFITQIDIECTELGSLFYLDRIHQSVTGHHTPPPPVSNEHYPFEPYFLCT